MVRKKQYPLEVRELIEKYFSYKSWKNYEKQELVLIDLISACEERGIDGDYYYELNCFQNEIKRTWISKEQWCKEQVLQTKWKEAMDHCDFESAYEQALKLRELQDGRTSQGELLAGRTLFAEERQKSLGAIGANSKNLNLAMKHFIAATEIDDSPEPYYYMARIESSLGHFEEAKTRFTTFYEYDKNTTYLRHIELIKIAVTEGKLEEAKNLYFDAMKTVHPILKSKTINFTNKVKELLPDMVAQKTRPTTPYVQINCQQKSRKKNSAEFELSPNISLRESVEIFAAEDSSVVKYHLEKAKGFLELQNQQIKVKEAVSYIQNLKLALELDEYLILEVRLAELLCQNHLMASANKIISEVGREPDKGIELKKALKEYDTKKRLYSQQK